MAESQRAGVLEAKRYAKDRHKFEAFTKVARTLVQSLLDESKLNYSSIESRTKTEQSFLAKTQRKDKSYKDPLSEITDLSAIRIIAEDLDSVDAICKLIELEFDVDPVNSLDKSKELKPHEVGYLSRHYVVEFNDERKKLKEYKSCANLRLEIQVRTVLQHAWSVVDHKISYKSGIELDDTLKRRLFILSGIFELADREFVDIIKSSNEAIVNANSEATSKDDQNQKYPYSLLVHMISDFMAFSKFREVFPQDESVTEESLTKDMKDLAIALKFFDLDTKSKVSDLLFWSIDNISRYLKFLSKAYRGTVGWSNYGCIEHCIWLKYSEEVTLQMLEKIYTKEFSPKLLAGIKASN